MDDKVAEIVVLLKKRQYSVLTVRHYEQGLFYCPGWDTPPRTQQPGEVRLTYQQAVSIRDEVMKQMVGYQCTVRTVQQRGRRSDVYYDLAQLIAIKNEMVPFAQLIREMDESKRDCSIFA